MGMLRMRKIHPLPRGRSWEWPDLGLMVGSARWQIMGLPQCPRDGKELVVYTEQRKSIPGDMWAKHTPTGWRVWAVADHPDGLAAQLDRALRGQSFATRREALQVVEAQVALLSS